MSENIKMEKIIIYLFTAIVSFAVYIFLTTDKRIVKTNSYEMFEHFSFFNKIDIDLILEMLD